MAACRRESHASARPPGSVGRLYQWRHRRLFGRRAVDWSFWYIYMPHWSFWYKLSVPHHQHNAADSDSMRPRIDSGSRSARRRVAKELHCMKTAN